MGKYELSSSTERALYACGPDRVFHNDGAQPGVAIRWLPCQVPPEEKWIAELAETRDEAGRTAAKKFAERLRAAAADLNAWAERIEKPLLEVPAP